MALWRSTARAGLGLAVMLTVFAAVISPKAAAAAEPNVFSFTGGEQTYTVPAGVTELTVHAVGAPGRPGGGFEGGTGGAGGDGASVTGDLAVVPGETLYVEVGGFTASGVGFGGGPGAFNGPYGLGGGYGGGGGGASDVRTCSMSSDSGCSTLDSRLVVAGGGGGGGGTDLSGDRAGGGGGSAQDGQEGDEGSGYALGGGGGGLYSGGYAGDQCPIETIGSSGGYDTADGFPGSFGQGSGAFDEADQNFGGGGGGGWFGGGSGVACGYVADQGPPSGYFGAGGGGGSSYGPPGAVFTQDTTGVTLVTIMPLIPAMSLTASSLAFGTEREGSTSSAKLVTITDGGNGPLNVSGWSLVGADPTDFVIDSWDCGGQIQPGQSCTLTVYFMPRLPGKRSAVLVLTSNDPARPAKLLLSGIGKATGRIKRHRPPGGTTCGVPYTFHIDGRTLDSGSCAGILGQPPTVTVGVGSRFSVTISHEESGRLDFPIPAAGNRHVRQVSRHGASVSYLAASQGTTRLWARHTPFCQFSDPAEGRCAVLVVHVIR